MAEQKALNFNDFFRNCPQCGREITYRQKASFKFATAAESLCKSCSAKQRHKFRDITGLKFGRLLVLSQTRYDGGHYYWGCLCECGEHTEASTTNLTRGEVKSCGCSKKHDNPWRRKRPYESLYNFLVHQAHKYNHPITLTYEEFLEFTQCKNCSYCGTELVWPGAYSGGAYAYNLDRKYNDLGYDKANLAPCCHKCNRAKGNLFTYDEFLVMMQALKAYRAKLDFQTQVQVVGGLGI